MRRGLALVLAAVLIGLVVLGVGFDDAGIDDLARPTATATPEPTPTPELPDEVLPPSSVQVLVANGTTVQGLAGSTSEQLGSIYGYTMLPATNATVAPADGLSKVFYAPGADVAARDVAGALGLATGAVQPLPATPPVDDATGADVLVVLGGDLAPGG